MDLSFLVLLFLFAVSSSGVESWNHSVSTVLVFGDSTVDPGNNNFINTGLKSNFIPYGMDLPSRIPKGRFCDGKLTTDFIATHLGIKDYIPPYLNKSLSIEELMTGVSFASAGSGYDPLTAQIFNVIPVQKQLQYFKEYKERLEVVMGTDKMKEHVGKAIFFLSCGTNDFGANYFAQTIRSKQYSVTEYQNFLIEKTRIFLQGFLDMGARKIGILGVPPLGCLPVLITMKSGNLNVESRQCLEYYSSVAKQYNQKLQNELQVMQNNVRSCGSLVVYIDIYEPLLKIIRDYKKIGFEEWRRGCCGSGLIEYGYLCNPHTPVCQKPTEFVFWDAVHPTERTYQLLFLAFKDTIDYLT